jgi:DNA modification methylase
MNHVMDQAEGDGWVLFNGDSAEVLPQLPAASVGLAVFSPPFSNTYTYSPSVRDLGNVASNGQFWEHFAWISRELLRVMMPGRLLAIHVADLPAYANRDGASGRKDFSGETIEHFLSAGFVYHSRFAINKNPQSQAIRTHSKGLLFVQMRRDRAALWQAWGDYVVVFRAPGENRVPVTEGFTEDDWVRLAAPVWSGRRKPPVLVPGIDPIWEEGTPHELDEPVACLSSIWDGIRETDVLDVRGARENDDERHLCPLQLPVIENAIRLWTNPGEVVLSPFAGIGSEGVGALRQDRKFVGIELKPAYWRVACRYLREARSQLSLFDEPPAAEFAK